MESTRAVGRRTPSTAAFFASFVLLAGLVVAGTALLVGRSIGDAVREESLQAAEREAQVFASLALEEDEFAGGALTGEAKDDLEDALAEAANVYGASVWSRELEVEFEHDPDVSEHEHHPDAELRRALAGEVVARVSDARVDRRGDSERGERVVDIFVPVRPRADMPPIAVFEAHLSYGPTRRDVARRQRRIYLILGGAALLLLGALIPTVLRASRALAESARRTNRPLQRRLRQAIARGELELHYQPKIELASRDVSGVEALLRWRHPTRGIVPPLEFLPAAERTQVMHPLTLHVIETAARQAAAWRAAGLELSVAVNLSPVCLADDELPAKILDRLRPHALEPACLMLEITETAAMEVADYRVLERLRDEGFALSIDDFGTGRSSLARLERLPVSELKIDRSFVLAMDAGRDGAVVTAVLALAHELEIATVAEGVESGEMADKLAELGCELAQGFHWTKPLPPDELVEWLASYRAKATA